MAAYGYDAYLKFQAWRAGEIAQVSMVGGHSATVTSKGSTQIVQSFLGECDGIFRAFCDIVLGTTTTVHAPPPGYAGQYPAGVNQPYAMPQQPQNLYPQQY